VVFQVGYPLRPGFGSAGGLDGAPHVSGAWMARRRYYVLSPIRAAAGRDHGVRVGGARAEVC
jgi:hypothetical protein